jgi:hypothetical protein
MVWTAIIGAAVSAYSARRASKGAKEQSQFEAMISKEAVPLSGFEARRTAEYENALMERSVQRERERRANAFRGLARQQGLAPQGYQFQNTIDVPELPDNPVPNDEVYQRVSGLGPQPPSNQPRGG